MSAYEFRSVEVHIPRPRLIDWVQLSLARETVILSQRTNELSARLKNPNVAQEMIESLAGTSEHMLGSYAGGDLDLPSHEKKEIASLARRVKELKDHIKFLLNVMIGLNEATDETIAVTLDLIHALRPGADEDDPKL